MSQNLQNARISSSSPAGQILKCASRGNISLDGSISRGNVSLDSCLSRGNTSVDSSRNEETPSPNLSVSQRFTSSDTLSGNCVEHTPSPGCLSRRNTYHSLNVPETPETSDTPSPINHKQRRSSSSCQVADPTLQEDVLTSKPAIKTSAVFGKITS